MIKGSSELGAQLVVGEELVEDVEAALACKEA